MFLQMGINDPFGNGNFPQVMDSSESLKISNVFGKAFLEVAEGGFETAAVTGKPPF